jgi:shikimate dehydrogenase
MGITGATRLCFILGRPVAHTLSPAMHNAAFAALALPYVYLPWALSPDGLAAAAAAFRAMENFAGANVTVPYKEAIRVHLDTLSTEAEGIGAVNTIVPREGRLIGHNTDGEGFIASLRDEGGVDPRGARVFLLGAGGGARGVAYALAAHGAAEIRVANRSPGRADAMVASLYGRFPRCQFLALPLQSPGSAEAVRSADVVINATSVGLAPDETLPLNLDGLRPTTLVCDLIYRPPETALLRGARSKGCRVLNGLGMLLHQGAAAFRLFAGAEAPLDVMRAALAQELARS